MSINIVPKFDKNLTVINLDEVKKTDYCSLGQFDHLTAITLWSSSHKVVINTLHYPSLIIQIWDDFIKFSKHFITLCAIPTLAVCLHVVLHKMFV